MPKRTVLIKHPTEKLLCAPRISEQSELPDKSKEELLAEQDEYDSEFMQGYAVFPDYYVRVFEIDSETKVYFMPKEIYIRGNPFPIITQGSIKRADDSEKGVELFRKRHGSLILAESAEYQSILEAIIKEAGIEDLGFNALLVSDFAMFAGMDAYDHHAGVRASPTYMSFATPIDIVPKYRQKTAKR